MGCDKPLVGTNEPGKSRQFLAATLVNVIAFSNGVLLGWSSPIIPRLQSEETPVGTVPFTNDQISWMNAVIGLGAVSILPFCNILIERFGRKLSACLIAIPSVVCWLLKIFATNAIYLLVARYLSGIGCAMSTLMIPLYVAEISADSVRGQLGTLMLFSIKCGIVTGYVLGAMLSYRSFAIVGMMMPILFLATFSFMPETPIYLVRKGLLDRATRSLMWLRSNDKPTVERELRRLQTLLIENPSLKKNSGFRDLFSDRGTIRAFIISLGLMTGQQTCGIFIMFTYTATIFKLAGSSLSPNIATIIVGIMQVLGAWLSIFLMERAGRRLLLLISSFGMAICHSTVAIFFLLQNLDYDLTAVTWIPLVALSAYFITYSVGVGPAPFVVVSEIFRAEVSSFANSISMIIMWIVSSLMMKFFPLMNSIIGLHGCFLVLATFCMLTYFFTYFLIPETKGRNIASIVDELNGFPNKSKDDRLNEATEMIKINKNSSMSFDP